jgi:hypothetical protein
MLKRSNNLKSKIANYSLVAAGALTMLSACKKDEDNNNSNIIETDLNPDISLTAPVNDEVTANIDFNNDGIVDVVAYSYYDASYGNEFFIGGLDTDSGSEFLTTEEVVSAGGSSYTLNVAKGLTAGSIISTTQLTWTDEAYLGLKGTYYGTNINVGQFLGSDKYVGVRFIAAGNTHYAWMLVGMAANGSSVTIKEYAYHITPNTPIGAGEK